MRPRIASITVTFLVLLLGASPVMAGGGWTTPQRLPSSSYVSDDGFETLLHEGTLYVALSSAGLPDGGIFLTTRTGQESSRIKITDSYDIQPSITMSRDGAIHIAFARMANYECFSPCSKGIFHATNASGSWVVTRVHRSVHDLTPSIAIRYGKVVIAFKGATGDGDRGLLFARRDQGVWETRLLDAACCGLDLDEGPSLSQNGDYVAYRRVIGGDSDIVMMHPTIGPRGRWVISSEDDARVPGLTVDADGYLHVALVQNGIELWHFISDGPVNPTSYIGTRLTDGVRGTPSIDSSGQRVSIVTRHYLGLMFASIRRGYLPQVERITTKGSDRSPDVVMTDGGKARVAFLREDGTDRSIWLTKQQECP
jgi:hypothetical protein